MDDAERQDILNEFLVKWMGGASVKSAEQELVKTGIPTSDLAYCRRIFEKWSASKKPWAEIRKMKV